MQKLHIIEDASTSADSAATILADTLGLAWPRGASVENLYFARAKLVEALANVEAVLNLGTSLTDTVTRNERDAYVEHLTPAIRQALTFRTASFERPSEERRCECGAPYDEEFGGFTCAK